MIYLDSSALLKLLIEESESAVLASWLSDQATTPIVSSELARLEVVRAARRLDAAVVPAARALVSQVDLIPLTMGLIDEAGGRRLWLPGLRRRVDGRTRRTR
jgi:predicted nucleic acid-binding protein